MHLRLRIPFTMYLFLLFLFNGIHVCIPTAQVMLQSSQHCFKSRITHSALKSVVLYCTVLWICCQRSPWKKELFPLSPRVCSKPFNGASQIWTAYFAMSSAWHRVHNLAKHLHLPWFRLLFHLFPLQKKWHWAGTSVVSVQSVTDVPYMHTQHQCWPSSELDPFSQILTNFPAVMQMGCMLHSVVVMMGSQEGLFMVSEQKLCDDCDS